ncbi:aminotransferase class I/II-fold pyridoxal phosphate-dependent enzyme [Novosphingobium sp. KCTC 2891]|uniref:aminotransferase class I/II-fold pyridoxal phosphate-dependent enzyme n=1 Tax=Novosphingobium sp. KCTC 2891 TaxID=2989730 RepID=UPI0022235C6B|nr:aminotransferase class I/II-fold pyridoxal phosphate-dependent enzyme [Novosphingobium sp. KCTC 2891]MCW1383727.1 aminotransferase class I/II-fold pyridoxal phosphate-dependent enzyme [Novosphingobium sp. KCTC 2891]
MSAEFTHHGGRLAEACARFGGKAANWLDLSTGINPFSWQPDAGLSVDWKALPDEGALTRLEHAAAGFFGCDATLCAAVPGSETGLRQLARLLALPGLHQPLSYGTYRAAFAQTDAIEDLAHLPHRASVLVLGNPNNPDGHILPIAKLLSLLDHQERHGGWLIVDEAFADCDPGWSIAGAVAPGRRLIVLRSFGKFFGLAGLRLGFVIAPPKVLEGLREGLGDWPVHAAALAFGAAAYTDRTWIDAARSDLTFQANALDAMLQRHGLSSRGGCPLFRLIVAPNAGDMFRRLAHRHILTRPFAERPDLLRIGLPHGDAAVARLDAALAEVCGHG